MHPIYGLMVAACIAYLNAASLPVKIAENLTNQ